MYDNNSYNDLESEIYKITPQKKKNIFMGGGGSPAVPNWTMILFMVIAIVFLVITLGDIKDYNESNKLIKEGNTVEAKVTKLRTHHRRKSMDTHSIYVSYVVDEVLYEDRLLSNSTVSEAQGAKIKIYYDKSFPDRITSEKVNSHYIFVIIKDLVIVLAFSIFSFLCYKDPEKWGKFFAPRKRRRW